MKVMPLESGTPGLRRRASLACGCAVEPRSRLGREDVRGCVGAASRGVRPHPCSSASGIVLKTSGGPFSAQGEGLAAGGGDSGARIGDHDVDEEDHVLSPSPAVAE